MPSRYITGTHAAHILEYAATRVVFSPPPPAPPLGTLTPTLALANLPQDSQEQFWSFVYLPQPAPAPPTPPVVIPPSTGGGGGGPVGKKRRKDSGPYMREGQVFGEEYAVSPSAGPPRARDAKGRFLKPSANLESGTAQRDTPPLWSLMLDTSFTDLDD